MQSEWGKMSESTKKNVEKRERQGTNERWEGVSERIKNVKIDRKFIIFARMCSFCNVPDVIYDGGILKGDMLSFNLCFRKINGFRHCRVWRFIRNDVYDLMHIGKCWAWIFPANNPYGKHTSTAKSTNHWLDHICVSGPSRSTQRARNTNNGSMKKKPLK